MSGCCGSACEVPPFAGQSKRYKRVLGAVIAINLGAFAVVATGGLLQGSATLAANALDFLADSATYGLTLWAIGQSAATRSGAALIKGGSLAFVALTIVGFALWRAVTGAAPEGLVISGLGMFGIAANLVAAGLLLRYREGDANVRSVWLCTRNDVFQCIAVALTGAAVMLTGSRWPDLVAGVVLAFIFLQSAWQIIAQARQEQRSAVSAAGAPVRADILVES